jgi:hypothetical protein
VPLTVLARAEAPAFFIQKKTFVPAARAQKL